METVFTHWQAENQMNPFFQLDRLDSRERIKYNLSADRTLVTFDADGNDSQLAVFLDGKTFKLIDWSEVVNVDTTGVNETWSEPSTGDTVSKVNEVQDGQSNNSELRPDKKPQTESGNKAVSWPYSKRK
jgi:hypothetical protein